ncbi:MAG TPA: alpha/beta hydrolase family protein [Edaphobacter sp.]
MRHPSTLLLSIVLSLGCTAPRHHGSQARVQQIVKVASPATITDVHFWSESLEAMLWYRIIIPPHEPAERLPVLYLLHGANSGPEEVMERSNVVDLASSEHLIVVIPEADNSYYTYAQHLSHARWEDAITIDLPHDVATNFAVQQGREHTGIGGISMGGYGAIKLTLKHPDLYSFTGVMNGPLDTTRRPPSLHRWSQTTRTWSIFGYLPSTRRNEDVFDILNHAPPKHDVRWFASVGKNDPLKPVNLLFVKKLNEHGVPLNVLMTPGGHDWQSWNTAMPQLIKTAAQTLR